MPKIAEATVAEHRAARRAALLAAATELLREHPEAPPSLGDVGARAGLSRSSVYHYFSSREDLLDAVVEATFPRWEQRLHRALDEAATPADVVRSYVAENIALVADGEHALARTLRQFVPTEHIGARSAEFHRRLAQPLEGALAEAGAPQPRVSAELINSMVLTGATLVESGAARDDVVRAILAMVDPYLAQLSA